MKPAAERFAEKVVRGESGCWTWTGATNSKGYACFRLHKGLIVLAHRWAYETQVGPIPKGLTTDHLCRNKLCVNVAHLELVTREENSRRRYAPPLFRPDETPGEWRRFPAARHVSGRVQVQGVVCPQLNGAFPHCQSVCGACGNGEGGASQRSLPSGLSAHAQRGHVPHRAVTEAEGGNGIAAPGDTESEWIGRGVAADAGNGGAGPFAVEGLINGATTTHQDETDNSETSAHVTPPGRPSMQRAASVFHGAGVGA